MKYIKTNLPLQQLAGGDTLTIQTHTFTGDTSGPKIYLQGNLHGPEPFGTSLLLELIGVLKKKKNLAGEVVIVPCANPMGLNQTTYNGVTGRWNPQSGINWNRIFPTSALKNQKEEKDFYKELLKKENLSIESKLAATLRSLSSGSQYVLDIHTTGSSNAEHLFTYSWMHDTFSALNTPVHLTLETNDVVGAFDESHVVPFIKSLSKKQIAHVATWEAHHHGNIDSALLKERLNQLLSWLDSIWEEETNGNTSYDTYSNSGHLHAPVAGYYSWTKQVGDKIKKGDVYANVYSPQNSLITTAKASFDFTLLGIYGAATTASGEQIGWIAY